MKTKQYSSKRRLAMWGSLIAAAIMLLGNYHIAQAQWTTNVNDVYKTNTAGNVGIGTTTPNNPLEVSSGSAPYAPAINILASTHATSRRAAISFGVSSAGTGGWAFGQDLNANGTRDMYLYDASNSRAVMYWSNSGNVGIGTTNPGYKLDVNGAINATGVNVSGSPLTSSQWATSGANIGYGAGNVAIGSGTPTTPLHVFGNGTITGNLTVGGNIAAKYQDVAEWVPSSEKISSGTVVVLDSTKSNQVIASTQPYDTRVAGVVSEQPGIALGESGKGKVLVATTGRVLVHVDATNGPIHIGDLLVTSGIPGVAMKSEPIIIANRKMHTPGTLIGKALEPLEKGSGKILVLLSLQ